MKANRNWLNEFVNISDIDSSELEERFTITGTKVETMELLGEKIKKVVIGEVLEITGHPDADKLVVTKVKVGTSNEDIIQIVTGAKNLIKGDIIPVCLHGGTLPNGVKIKKGKLRGIESNGMLCSIDELGFSTNPFIDQEDEKEGIMVLPKEFKKHLGENVVPLFNLDDIVFDFEITPNRADCNGVLGIARELSVAVKRDLKEIKIPNTIKELEELSGFKIKSKLDDLEVNILDDDCKKYIAIVIDDVKLGESPDFIVDRLNKVGLHSINNAVDLTNYIMQEIGQPLHAFDKKLVDGQINIRTSKKGEKITLLDEKEYDLDGQMVISDKNKPIAVAGVMGGVNLSVNENTNSLIIEIAAFDGPRVRRSARDLNVRTDASGRYEKRLPISLTYLAAMRVKELAEIMELGNVRDEILVVGNSEDEKIEVEFDKEYINNLLGMEIPEEFMLDTFNRLKFDTTRLNEKNKNIIIPYYRPDISIKADLAEEVLRFYGYDKLNTTLPKVEEVLGKENKMLELKSEIRSHLISNDFSEIFTYGFVNDEAMLNLNLDKDDCRLETIRIKNRLSSDYSVMRTTLVPSILNIVKNNLDLKNENINIFDLSRIYIDEGKIKEGDIAREDEVLAIATTNDFFYLKEIVFKLMNRIGAKSFRYDRSDDKIYHPGKSIKMFFGKDIIGNFGEINPKVAKNFGIKKNINVLELNLTKLSKYINFKEKYVEISKYPSVKRDISMIVNEEVTYAEIEKIVKDASKKLLESVKLFDIFRSKELKEKNKKSMAISIILRDEKATLKEDKIKNIMENITKNLTEKLDVNIRM